MIDRLKKKIFWIIELMPLSVIFLVLVAYNISNISFILNDEKDVLDYCSNCISKYSSSIESYMQMDVNDLIDASESNKQEHVAVTRVLYSLISSELSIVKTDSDGKIINYIDVEDNSRELSDLVGQVNIEICKHRYSDGKLYNIEKIGDAYYIIFLDTKSWRAEIIRVLILSLAALFISAISLGLIARALCKRVTAPIEETIAKQSRFVADASHELKTPISVINANISVLESEVGSNKWMDYIKTESSSMTELINQLLDLSKLDYEITEKKSNNTDIIVSFDASETLMETVLPFDIIAFEKNISVSTECPDNITCKGNRDEFKKLVSILVDNAICHSTEGGYINIYMDHSCLKISNSSSTISEEDLPFLFNRFYKSKTSENSQNNNYGLGLSIAEALAKKNDYSLSVESKDNITTFSLMF